jgi:hypothetical protein
MSLLLSTRAFAIVVLRFITLYFYTLRIGKCADTVGGGMPIPDDDAVRGRRGVVAKSLTVFSSSHNFILRDRTTGGEMP